MVAPTRFVLYERAHATIRLHIGDSIMNRTYCSFCEKEKLKVKVLISGNDVHICNECVDKANRLIKMQLNKLTLKTETQS